MFSVSTIYSAKDFLKLLKKHDLSTSEFLNSFKRYQYDSAEKVLKLVVDCRWVYLDFNGNLKLTERGLSISMLDYKKGLLVQLEDMILIYNPTWGSSLTKGRNETLRFLPESPKQCFKEAGFMDELNDELIDVWDRLALAYRNYSNQNFLKTGREGERLSIKFESSRTLNKPIWQAIESNLSGYDLLSVIDNKNMSPLLIEVKSSTSKLEFANFYISKNEWKVAKNAENYIFHLWLISSKPEHFIVSVDRISNHIPKNFGDGQWESVQIPFRSVI